MTPRILHRAAVVQTAAVCIGLLDLCTQRFGTLWRGGIGGRRMEYGLIGGALGHSYSKLIHEQLCGYTYELCPPAR